MRVLFRKIGQIGLSLPVIVTLVALCIGSYFVIVSATYNIDDLKNAPLMQVRYIAIGFAVYFLLALTPYRLLVRIAPILYVAAILMLIGCFIPGLGRNGHGANSWLRVGHVGFEPAEFAKLAYILSMAWFLRFRESQIHSIWTVLIALGMTIVPFFLIKEQPAFGTAAVFIPVCFTMLFAAGARWYYIILPMLLAVGAMMAVYYWVCVWNKPVPFLKEFQVNRIKVFFDPSLDSKGAGWQIDQSMIAIGVGGMDGKGWREGTETSLGYLPAASSYNDFIFAVVGEAFGFHGAAALILGEGTVLLWCIWVAARTRDKVGALLAVGVMAMLFTHIFVNIGMTIHLVPITGIPLPFISYGGTFLIACLAGMGLVQSVWVHRKNFERA